MFLISKIKRFIVLIILIAVLFLGAKYYFSLNDSSSINTSRASVIKEMRNLQRLETASFTIEKIIDGGTTGNNVFQKFLFGDRILLIAHGQAIGGFDFSQFSEKDIEIDGKNIRLTLPKPQILITSLDNTQTRVYDRQKGILNPGIKDLESEARRRAEISIKEAACAGGILNQASENGRKQLTALLMALGFTEVSIEIPQGECI